jgi:hypothetical protein
LVTLNQFSEAATTNKADSITKLQYSITNRSAGSKVQAGVTNNEKCTKAKLI